MAFQSLVTSSITAGKFGDKFDNYEDEPDVSLNHQIFGKVMIDCQLSLSKSRWGILGASEKSGGIIYMSLKFNQPDKDCKLSSATVLVTLSGSNPREIKRGKGHNDLVSNELHITDHYGPEQLWGENKLIYVKRNLNMTPNFTILGNGISGLGWQQEKEAVYCSRWKFNGQRIPVNHDGKEDFGTSVYRTLKWELSENDFEPDIAHGEVFHTAFAFGHEGKPFFMEINVKGRLRRTRDQFKQFMNFPRRREENKGSSLMMIWLPRGNKFSARLDNQAKNLREEMKQENLACVPVEVPGVSSALNDEKEFEKMSTSRIYASQSTLATSTQAQHTPLLKKTSTPALPLSDQSLDPISSNSATVSIEDIAKLVDLRFSSQFSQITSQNVEVSKRTWIPLELALAPHAKKTADVTDASSLSGLTCVEDEQEKTKEESDKNFEEAWLRLRKSPVILLVFQILFGLVDLFGQKTNSRNGHPSEGTSKEKKPGRDSY